jgi:hypothetical protein
MDIKERREIRDGQQRDTLPNKHFQNLRMRRKKIIRADRLFGSRPPPLGKRRKNHTLTIASLVLHDQRDFNETLKIHLKNISQPRVAIIGVSQQDNISLHVYGCHTGADPRNKEIANPRLFCSLALGRTRPTLENLAEQIHQDLLGRSQLFCFHQTTLLPGG